MMLCWFPHLHHVLQSPLLNLFVLHAACSGFELEGTCSAFEPMCTVTERTSLLRLAALASMEGPFLVMRSTHAEPRCYGARLYVGEGYDDEDFGSMVWMDNDPETWDQVCSLVKAAFGDKAVQRLIPDEKTSDTTVPNRRCVYVLKGADRWTEQHPYFGPEISVHYRIPGTHPDEDVWESADAESFVKVPDDEGSLWYVADLADGCGGADDAYLMLHMDISLKSLRKDAVNPNVEVM